jgi:hypothetical protein
MFFFVFCAQDFLGPNLPELQFLLLHKFRLQEVAAEVFAELVSGGESSLGYPYSSWVQVTMS